MKPECQRPISLPPHRSEFGLCRLALSEAKPNVSEV